MIRYNEAKGELKDYINSMEDLYKWHKEMLEKYEGDIFEYEEYDEYDIEEGIRFIRLWDCINKLSVKDKNLICLYQIYRPRDVLKVFSDDVKNTQTLSKMYYKAKAKLKELFINN